MATGPSEERTNRGACAALDLPDGVLARFLPIATAAQEVAAFGYFDPEWRLLAMRHLPPRCVDAVRIPFRTIVADALACGCALVVMAHNHPSGDPTPSLADCTLTRRMAQALQFIDVALFDHLVIAANGYRSFRARGLL